MRENKKATTRVARSIIESSLEAETVSPAISDRLERTAGGLLQELVNEVHNKLANEPKTSDFAQQLMEGMGYTPGERQRQEKEGVERTQKRMRSMLEQDIRQQIAELDTLLKNMGEDNRDVIVALYESKVEQAPSLELKREIEGTIQKFLLKRSFGKSPKKRK